MRPLVSRDLWQWIEENRETFQPPVGNKVIWEDSQYTAMVIHGPNARRDFHIDPSDEIFYQLRGDIVVEHLDGGGQRQHSIVGEGELFLMPAFVPHAPHRPADSWGLVIEIKRRPDQTESLLWICEQCNARLHEVTMHVANIETELKLAIEQFNASAALRTCQVCGYVQPATVAPIDPPRSRATA
ncbi:MAG: 3-hydroxyanthranilate 3,4-dioxygenase [Chloroflexota bacterium]|jgi:3-hydroxyanthranilate 3,4-dioxygenase|nr:3-hydroxyanthranilate 3,4-dioxygenase [Chloroflexota bacterium]